MNALTALNAFQVEARVACIFPGLELAGQPTILEVQSHGKQTGWHVCFLTRLKDIGWLNPSYVKQILWLWSSKIMCDRGQLILHCLVLALERILCTFLGTQTDDRLSRFETLYKGWRNSLTIWTTSQDDHSNSVWLLLTNISWIGGEVEPLEEPKREKADLRRAQWTE